MLAMNTFNPMTYFRKEQEQSQEQEEQEQEQEQPVEYIIRTRSQKALATAQQEQEQQEQEQSEQEQSEQEQEEQEQDLSAQEQEEQEEAQVAPESPRRRAAAASYKSIIRTRSQKLAESRDFMTKMFADINAFYELNQREPSATQAQEQAMASFLKSLRDANAAGKLGGQSAIDMVHAHMPWFNFEEPEAVTCWNRTMVVRLRINLAAIFVLCAYLSVFVGGVYVAERCYNDVARCPTWLLDAGDALTAAENYLNDGFSTVTHGTLTALQSYMH